MKVMPQKWPALKSVTSPSPRSAEQLERA